MSIKKNTLWNLAGNGLPLVAGAVAVPYLMKNLGTEKFGILTIIWTLIGYLSLFDFGLGRALTQITANNLGTRQEEENPELLATGVYLTSMTGVIGAIALIVLAYPLAFFWLNISSGNQYDGYYALVLTAIAVPVTTVSAAFRGALEGYEKFRDTNIVRVFFGTACFLFPVFAVALAGASLSAVTISLVVCRIITFVFFLYKVKKLYGSYRYSIKPYHAFKDKLLGFGSWMTLSNVISPILVSADRFIISGALGAAVVAYYTLPFEFIVRLLIIPGAIGVSLFPRLSSLFTTNISDGHRLVRKCVLVTAGIMVACCIIVVALYIPIVSVWIDRIFAEKSFIVAIILCGGALINAVGYVYYTAVQAKDGAKATGILHLLELVVYVPLLVIMVDRFGIIGAASAWTARIAFDSMFLYLIYNRGRTVAI